MKSIIHHSISAAPLSERVNQAAYEKSRHLPAFVIPITAYRRPISALYSQRLTTKPAAHRYGYCKTLYRVHRGQLIGNSRAQKVGLGQWHRP